MKKFIVIAFAACCIACNDTETDNDTFEDSTAVDTVVADTITTVSYTPVEGDVSYKEKKVYVMKNGEWVEAKEDVKLDNDVIIYKSGKVVKNDKEIELKEGEIVNKTGDFFDKTGRAVENAWDDTKDAVKDAGEAVGDAAKKVGKEIDTAVSKDK